MNQSTILSDNWRVAKLEETDIEIVDGDRGKNYPKKSELLKKGYCPFLNNKNLQEDKLSLTGVDFISEEKDNLLRKGKAYVGDIIITTRGSVGNVGILHEGIGSPFVRINSGMVILRNKDKNIDTQFLYQQLKSQILKEQYKTLSTGTAQPQLPIKDLKRAELILPPIEIQRTISSIMGSLEYKLELNRQTNETLKQMAMMLYKHWFVDFCPFQDGEFENSELGRIPKGWKVKSLKEVADVNKRNLKSDYKFKRIEYIDISSVKQGLLYETANFELEKAPSRAKRLVQHGDIIWSTVRPNRKSYFYIDNPKENIVVSTGFAVLSPKLIPSSYLYNYVTSDTFVDYLTNAAEGSAYPAVNAGVFKESLIILPSSDILMQFDNKVSPFSSLIALNNHQNKELALSRDYLISRLLSGQVDVSQAKEQVKEVLNHA